MCFHIVQCVDWCVDCRGTFPLCCHRVGAPVRTRRSSERKIRPLSHARVPVLPFSHGKEKSGHVCKHISMWFRIFHPPEKSRLKHFLALKKKQLTLAAIEETFPSCEFGEIFVIATKPFFHPEQRVGEKWDWLLNRIIEISPSSLNNNTLVYNED